MTTGPISLPGPAPGPTLTSRAFVADHLDQRVGRGADGDRGRDRHAALAGRAEGRGDEVVGGEVEVGVGQHDRVVLGAAERLHPLAGAVARSWMYLAIGVEPTKETARDVRVVEQRVDGHLVAVHHVEDAVRQPGLGPEPATRSDADGSRSLGLSTKVLPQAIATGCIHIGTMAGKLNGVMPATTPSGWRKEYESTPVETWSE